MRLDELCAALERKIPPLEGCEDFDGTAFLPCPGREARRIALALDANPRNFRVVEDLPQFPGGAVELMKWLTKNLRYPQQAQKKKIEGKVIVQFIVTADGSMSNLQIIKKLEASCDNEAMRVMRMMPKWKPGVQDGKPCRTMVCIPIVFKL